MTSSARPFFDKACSEDCLFDKAALRTLICYIEATDEWVDHQRVGGPPTSGWTTDEWVDGTTGFEGTHKHADRRICTWMDGRMDTWTDKWTDGPGTGEHAGGRAGGWTDGWTHGRTNKQTYRWSTDGR
eukprot:363351-Chlamydomonas_euryale.AAC.11